MDSYHKIAFLVTLLSDALRFWSDSDLSNCWAKTQRMLGANSVVSDVACVPFSFVDTSFQCVTTQIHLLVDGSSTL